MDNKEEKKSNVGLIVFIVISVIIILFIFLNIFFTNVVFKNIKQQIIDTNNEINNNINDNNENQNNIIKEVEVAPDDKLKENITILLQSSMDKYLITNLFEKETISDIEYKDKIGLVLRYSIKDNNSFKPSEYDSKGLSQNGKNEYNTMTSYSPEVIYYTKSDRVIELYNQIFDKGMILNNDYHDNGNGYYLYDSVNNLYIIDFISGTSFDGRLDYVYKYTKMDNTYSVYVAAGYIEPTTNDDYKVYKSSITKELYSTITDEQLRTFKIDKLNYQNFDHFKFTFERNSEGNYIYKSIERIK